MNEKKDGGPAFPVYDETGMYPVATGMTLRDWFAGQALAGMVGHISSEKGWGILGITCYQAADMMLAAREVKS